MQTNNEHSRQDKHGRGLLPNWAALIIGLVASAALCAYFSPDMRAVLVAAWLACF